MNLTLSVLLLTMVSAQKPCENGEVKAARKALDEVDSRLKSQ